MEFESWRDRKNILCIRPDNLGDVLMSSPAMRALKESFGCRITLLTSPMGAGIARYIPDIDNVIVANISWVKGSDASHSGEYMDTVAKIREGGFDAAVIFTVFSQNPVPSIMLAYLADIPYRLAYCRENPYQLLTHWVPDREPYDLIRHQVERDLGLVTNIGAAPGTHHMRITIPGESYAAIKRKISSAGLDFDKPWLIVHPCASEEKRNYPQQKLVEVLEQLTRNKFYQVVLTGTSADAHMAKALTDSVASGVINAAGLFSLADFMALVDMAPVLLSVNSGSVHIAAACRTPVVVLYAATNPQHTPWMTPHRTIYFPVENKLKSRNEVLRYVDRHVNQKINEFPDCSTIVEAVTALMKESRQPIA